MFHCHVCGSTESREEFVDEVFRIKGKHVLVEHVRAKVCVRCSEKTFSRETTEKIRRIVHGEAEPVKSISLDVFEYA